MKTESLQPILKLDFNERADKPNPLFDSINFPEELWRYPDRKPLENRIARLNNLQLEQVICTNGGDEAIMILMRIIKESNKKLILPLPAFSQYTWGIKSWKLEPFLVEPLQNLCVELDETLSLIKSTPNAICILTRPNNPTGESIPMEKLINFISASKNNNGWIFLDEAYIEFSEETFNAGDLLKQFDNLIILRTFSKAYGLAGVRLGYVLASENIIKEFQCRCAPFNIPTPSLAIGLSALEENNQKEMNNYCKTIQSNRKKLGSWFNKKGIESVSSQANFILIRLPVTQAKATQSFLAKNRVLVREFTEPALAGCLRITIPFELERLHLLLEQCFAPKLICMDMDGVLIDTSQSYDQCVLATVKILSGKEVSLIDIETLRKQGGFNNDWVLSQKLLTDLGFNFNLNEVTEVFQSVYLGNENAQGLVKNEKIIISENLVEIINRRKGIAFTIVTGRPKNEARTGQKMINLSSLDVISLDDVIEGKPSPEGINQLQKQYSSLSWMCGDNPDDMQAAVASNSLAIGIGTNKVDALYDAGADVVLNSINELEAWLCHK